MPSAAAQSDHWPLKAGLLFFVDLNNILGLSCRGNASDSERIGSAVLGNHLRVHLNKFSRLRAADNIAVSIEARVSAGVVIGRAGRRMRLAVIDAHE